MEQQIQRTIVLVDMAIVQFGYFLQRAILPALIVGMIALWAIHKKR